MGKKKMVKGFMGIEYATDEIKNGQFVDPCLESDFVQARFDLLRGTRAGRGLVNENEWRKVRSESARKDFLKMLESMNNAENFEVKPIDTDDGTVDDNAPFIYDGTKEPPKTIKTVIIKAELEEIQDKAFKDCSELKSVVFNDQLKKIGKNAFENCTKLENIRLNDVDFIGDEAFLNCTGILAVELGSSIQHIGMGAFKNCTKLTKVSIPANVTFIGDYAFANCTSMKNAMVLDGATSLPKFCFQNCTSLEQVILPSSINLVGDNAFENCPNVEVMVPTLHLEEAEELLRVKMVAKAEDDDTLLKCNKGFMVRLYKEYF